MAIRPLNSVAGFSVGEVPTSIILANGDVTTTNITTTGVANLNSIGNVKISGGSSGQVIQTDGAGNLTFATLNTAALANGNSNIQVFANSDVTVSVGGVANIGVFTSTGFDVAGYIAGNDITADGNLSVNNYIITPSATDLVIAPDTSITRFSSNVNPFTGGYSLGNATARWDNIYSNTANVFGNIEAGGLLTDNLYYANGTAWDFAQPAGANTEIQFNDGAGGFGASNAFTFDYTGNVLTVTGTANIIGNLTSNNANLGNLATANFVNVSSNVNVTDTMEAGNVRTDNLLYANGQAWDFSEPAGANTQIQYNDGANGFGASNAFTFNYSSNVLTVVGNAQFDNANLGNLATANYANFTNDVVVQGNIANANNISVTNNITSDTANVTGNLTAGNVDGGNLVTANNFSTNGSGGDITMSGGNLTGANVVIANSFTSNGGTIDFATNNPNVNLGNVGNVHITGGTTGYLLTTDGTGNLSWTATASTNQIFNGNSNVEIPIADGNVYINANSGVDQQWVFDVDGNLTAPSTGTANLGNLVVANYGNFINDLVVQGNIANANNVSVTNNITAGSANVIADLDVGGNIVTGNGSGGNISGVNYITANVANISDVVNTGKIANGSSNVRIDQNGNITLSSNNVSNVFTFSDVGANIVGYVSANGDGSFGAVKSNSVTSQGGNLELYSEQSGNSYIQLRTFGDGTVDVGNVRITSLAMPNASTDAASKQYVDDVAQGLNVHDSALAATANTLANLTGGVITYNNGVDGVGANLVLSGTPTLNYLSANVFDGNVTAIVGSRILVKSEATAAYNGVYVVDSSTVLTRAADYNTVPEVEAGDFIFVQDGTTYNDSGWVQTSVVATIGTDPIVFTQFSGAGTYQAGSGLTLTGTVFSVNVDNITTEVSGGNVIVKANAQFTTPNIGAATGTSVDLTGNVLAGNVNSNAMITTVDLDATGNIIAANITANANLVVNNATVNLELSGNTANFSGNVFAPAIIQNASTYDTRLSLSSTTGIVEISTDGNATQFKPSGQISLSGASQIVGGVFSGSGITLGASQTDIFQNRGGNVTVQVGTGGTTAHTWTFGQDGNLDTPGNVNATNIDANGSVIIGNSTITTATTTTTSIGGNQTISSYTMTGSGVTGVEWLVKGVDDNLVAPKYTVVTVQAVTDGTDVDYTLFGGVYLGGTTGSIAVNIVGSAIELQVTPASSNSTVWTTQYRLI